MGLEEKINLAAQLGKLYLFKEGVFYKAYNQNAMWFVQNIKPYKVTVKHIKYLNQEVFSVGFPVNYLDTLNFNNKILKTNDCTTNTLCYTITQKNNNPKKYTNWCASLPKQKVPIIKIKRTEIIKQLQNFEMANKTPIEAFELDLEHNLCTLAQKIYDQTYQPKPAIAFIVYKPVQREIFAADFSDRVVHHLIYRCLYHKHIDPFLIKDSYSCRKGKGTLYGIKRATHFIRSCSENYTKNAYILKLDITGYFMNMNQRVLFNKVMPFITLNEYLGIPSKTITNLIYKIIFKNVATNCRIKGAKNNWDGLPKDKSLFNKPNGVGLPIGNLTSQIFGNIYLNQLDNYIKKNLQIKYYGRYVDDMIFVHHNKAALVNIIPKIQTQLDFVGLKIHPKKIYLQHYTKGVLFLGQYIKPYRSYISNRTKANFYSAIRTINVLVTASFKISWVTMKKIRTLLNSYLGTLSHAKCYHLITKALQNLNSKFYYFFGFTKNYSKTYIKTDYWQWHYTQIFLSTKQVMMYY